MFCGFYVAQREGSSHFTEINLIFQRKNRALVQSSPTILRLLFANRKIGKRARKQTENNNKIPEKSLTINNYAFPQRNSAFHNFRISSNKIISLEFPQTSYSVTSPEVNAPITHEILVLGKPLTSGGRIYISEN